MGPNFFWSYRGGGSTLLSRRVKDEVLRAAADELKGTGKFVSEDLTKLRSKLSYECRQRKRAKVIEDTWVRNGKVWARFLDGSAKEIRAERELPPLPAAQAPAAAAAAPARP